MGQSPIVQGREVTGMDGKGESKSKGQEGREVRKRTATTTETIDDEDDDDDDDSDEREYEFRTIHRFGFESHYTYAYECCNSIENCGSFLDKYIKKAKAKTSNWTDCYKYTCMHAALSAFRISSSTAAQSHTYQQCKLEEA